MQSFKGLMQPVNFAGSGIGQQKPQLHGIRLPVEVVPVGLVALQDFLAGDFVFRISGIGAELQPKARGPVGDVVVRGKCGDAGDDAAAARRFLPLAVDFRHIFEHGAVAGVAQISALHRQCTCGVVFRQNLKSPGDGQRAGVAQRGFPAPVGQGNAGGGMVRENVVAGLIHGPEVFLLADLETRHLQPGIPGRQRPHTCRRHRQNQNGRQQGRQQRLLPGRGSFLFRHFTPPVSFWR